ncbi:exosome complex exonuclease Rrp41 [Candidatus Woesearchaeota archaeon]|nr:exosome complex exonuclease Rrp41 [Candidatus Woesearchaeota archaeon]
MAYEKRFDGRAFEDTREIDAKAGVVKNADGSAWFKIGKTEAIAAVYGPREIYPRFKQNAKEGVLQCFYNMMPFSGMGDRVRPGGNRRSKEISMVITNALKPALDLSEYPNSAIDVFIELPKTDAGSRCASICAAAIALADAGIPMKDVVSAVAVGIVDGTVLVDLDYAEEAFEGEVADIPIAVIPSTGELTLLQMDGRISKDNLIKALELGKQVSLKISEVQKKALKEVYEVQNEN